MILKDTDIQKIVKSKNPDYEVNVAYEATLDMIVNGTNFSDYLIAQSTLQNKKQTELRQKYCKSTKAIAANILRPLTNIFTAIGGSREYIVEGSETFQKNQISEFNKAMKASPMDGNVQTFMQAFWAKKVVDSPRSCFLIERSKDGKYVYPIFIQQKNITNWKYKGNFDYEYLCIFEGDYILAEKPVKLFRVIDEIKDYSVVLNEKNEVTIVQGFVTVYDKNKESYEFLTIDNTFGFVPGVQLTDKLGADMRNKISLLDTVVELFQDYLLDSSIKRLFKFLHGYPYFVEYNNRTCHTCMGTGKDRLTGNECSVCGGSGLRKKDVSDVVSIDIPDDKDEHLIKPAEWAAYIAPSIETWKQINEDLQQNKTEIEYTIWGSKLVEDTENKHQSTLGARVLDVKPINDKLSEYSNIAQQVDKKITDIIAKFYLPKVFKESVVLYGNFFLTNTPDKLLEQYNTLLLNVANYQELDKALSDYYHTIYSKDPMKLKIALRDIQFEPYRHDSIEKVQLYSINETIKTRKKYYQIYRKSITDAEFLKFASVDEFNTALDVFSSKYKIEIQNENTKQRIGLQEVSKVSF